MRAKLWRIQSHIEKAYREAEELVEHRAREVLAANHEFDEFIR